MPSRNVLILTALRLEADGIARGLRLRAEKPTRSALTLALSREYTGEGTEFAGLRMIVVGPSATRLPTAVPQGCEGVILAGLGGGLSPELKRGDVVIDEASTLSFGLALLEGGTKGWVLDHDGARRSSTPPTPPSPSRGEGVGIVSTDVLRRMKFVTADRVVSTVADKAALHRETGGAVVDMESDVVRAWATARGLPFLGLRAISDTAAEPLDPAVLRFVDADGVTRASHVLREVIRKPALVATLWRLRHSSSIVQILAEHLQRGLRA